MPAKRHTKPATPSKSRSGTNTPETLAALAERHGVSRPTLRKWRDEEGLDIYDSKAVEERKELKQVSSNEDMHAAKLRRARADADRAECAAARERGILVERSGIAAEGERIGRMLQTRLGQLGAELPGMLGGMKPGDMQKVIVKAHRELLQELYEELGKV